MEGFKEMMLFLDMLEENQSPLNELLLASSMYFQIDQYIILLDQLKRIRTTSEAT